MEKHRNWLEMGKKQFVETRQRKQKGGWGLLMFTADSMHEQTAWLQRAGRRGEQLCLSCHKRGDKINQMKKQISNAYMRDVTEKKQSCGPVFLEVIFQKDEGTKTGSVSTLSLFRKSLFKPPKKPKPNLFIEFIQSPCSLDWMQTWFYHWFLNFHVGAGVTILTSVNSNPWMWPGLVFRYRYNLFCLYHGILKMLLGQKT